MRKSFISFLLTALIPGLSISILSCNQLPVQLAESQPEKQPPAESTIPITEVASTSPEAPLTLTEYISETTRIFTSLEFADQLQYTLRERSEHLKWGDDSVFPTLERIVVSYAEECSNALKQWNSIIPPQEFAEFHNCYLTVLTEQELLSKSLLNAVSSRNVEEVLSNVSVIGSSRLSKEDEALMNSTFERYYKHLIPDYNPPPPTPAPTPHQPTLTPTPEIKREAYETSVPLRYSVNSYGDEAWYEDESNEGKKAPDLWFEWVNLRNLDSDGGVFTVTFLVKFGDVSKKYSTSEFVSSGETKKIKTEGHKQIATGGFTFSVTPPTRTVIAYRDIPSEPSQTPTPQATLNKNDFVITVNSPRQVTLTNNSKRSVEVYKFSVKYDCYSYVIHNAPGGGTSYGPIVRSGFTSDESKVLQTGQSYPRTLNSRDIVTIVSCSFYIKDVSTGQTLTITFP